MAGVKFVLSAGRATSSPFSVIFSRQNAMTAALRSYSCVMAKPKNLVNRGYLTSHLCSRHYCDDGSSKPMPMPRLMEFPQFLWPSIFKVVKNWIMAKFIITPYFDNEFDLNEFGDASRKAIEHVSMCLSRNDLDSLQGLVSREALVEVKSSLSRFSVQQMTDLAIDKDDIYFCFPHEVGVMYDDEDASQKRFVEITMVYFLMKGLTEYQKRHGHPPEFHEMRAPENQDKMYVLNYRFIREFTKGVAPDWTINMLNHYKGNKPQ